jgi:hypothetical protein
VLDRRAGGCTHDWQRPNGGKCAEANNSRGCFTGHRSVARGVAVRSSQAGCVTIGGRGGVSRAVAECGSRGRCGCARVAQGHMP